MDNPQAATPSRPWLKFVILAVFIVGFATFFAFGGQDWLSLETLKAQRELLLAYTEQHYLLSLLIAGLIYAAAVALSLPGAVILSLAVGLMFGRWVGTGLIVTAATIGAVLVFFAARYLFAETVKKRLGGGLAQKLIAGFNEDAFSYLLFLRLVPVFPFWLVNLTTSALTPVSLRVYATATFLGIIPGSFVFANLGQSLGRIDSLGQLLSVQTIGALVLLGVFALAPILIKKWRAKKNA